MESWNDMSRAALDAAQFLLDNGHLRSSISRAYYAAYCAVASRAAARLMSYPYGRNNPSHEQLTDLVLYNFSLPANARYEVNKALRRLRRGREDADYRPHAVIERNDAIKLFRDAAFVLDGLGIPINDE